jgi:hypothetical protein
MSRIEPAFLFHNPCRGPFHLAMPLACPFSDTPQYFAVLFDLRQNLPGEIAQRFTSVLVAHGSDKFYSEIRSRKVIVQIYGKRIAHDCFFDLLRQTMRQRRDTHISHPEVR